jgi:DNA-binding MarR family transcriptional regulator
MPIEIHHSGDDPIDVQPGTNEARILTFLTRHPDTAFTKAELAERTDVKTTSVYKTVDRLIEKGLVERHADGDHIHVTQDRRDAIYRRLRSFKDSDTYERLFDDDYFAEQPEWAEEFPDLGREPLPTRDVGTTRDDREPELDEMGDMPDLDE